MPDSDLEQRVRVLEKALDVAAEQFAQMTDCFVCPVEHCPNFLSWGRGRDDCKKMVRTYLEVHAEEALDA